MSAQPGAPASAEALGEGSGTADRGASEPERVEWSLYSPLRSRISEKYYEWFQGSDATVRRRAASEIRDYVERLGVIVADTLGLPLRHSDVARITAERSCPKAMDDSRASRSHWRTWVRLTLGDLARRQAKHDGE